MSDQPPAATVSSPEDEPTVSPSKPERILRAAERLLVEAGHTSLTVDAIAREAGVSRGLLHYYFGSMEDILAQVVRRNAESSLEVTGRVLAQTRGKDDLLEALLVAFRSALGTQPNLYVLYFEAFVESRVHAQVRDELAALYQQRRAALASHLEAAAAAGAVRLPHGPETTAGIVIALADGGALQVLADPTTRVDDLQVAARQVLAPLFEDGATDPAT